MTEKNNPELFKRQKVDTRHESVLFKHLLWEPELYSFRDKKALKTDSTSIAELAEDIRQTGGLLTPLLVRYLSKDKWLVLDGHRRKAAIEHCIKKGYSGFEIETLIVPVTVIVSEISKREELMRAASANVARLDFSKTERARIVKTLHDEKCPEGEIRRILGIKETQYKRDLLIASTNWMMELVEDKCVNFSTASRLLKTADSQSCENKLRTALLQFVKSTKAKLEAENKRRRANDQKEKTGDQLNPEKYLKADQVATWEADMKAGRELSEATFKFKALISKSKGVKTLEISSINRNLAEMDSDQVAKVVKRLNDVLEELEPEAVAKRQQEEKQIELDYGIARVSRGAKRLAELGLDFEDDEDVGSDGELDEMDEGSERSEADIISSIELPITSSRDFPEDEVEDDADEFIDGDDSDYEDDEFEEGELA